MIDLHLGDCLDPVTGLASLADKSVDHVITDPPYEAEAHTDQRRQKGAGWREKARAGIEVIKMAPLDFPPIDYRQRIILGEQFGRVAKTRALVFCQVEAVQDWRTALNRGGLTYRRSIPCTKPDAMPSLHGRWPGQSFETLVLAMRPSATPCPVGGKSVVYSFPRARGDNPTGKAPHPTTKPLDLMLAIIEDFTSPGDTILDPFAGSGTTGVACRILGRNFIGWELNPEYHAIATRRLNGDEAKPRPEQPSLFGGTR